MSLITSEKHYLIEICILGYKLKRDFKFDRMLNVKIILKSQSTNTIINEKKKNKHMYKY